MRSFSTLIAAFAIAGVHAQVQHGGRPVAGSNAGVLLTAAHAVDLSGFAHPNVAAMIAEDANATKATPLRFGYVIPVVKSLQEFSKDTIDNSTVYRLAITSPKALGMGINLKTFYLPKGVRMFVYSQDLSTVHGSFTDENHKHYGGFSVMPVKGNTIVLEVQVPSSTTELPVIVTDTVVHHYKPTIVGGESPVPSQCFGCSAACNVDVSCEVAADWAQESAGVTAILTTSGSALCSGSLINNAEEDGRQLYLSAYHCGGAMADDWIFLFNYETNSCGGTAEPSKAQTVQGTKLLANNGYSDFVLLEIEEAIPAEYGAVLNGFDASDVPVFDVPFSISHPSGDVKKAAVFRGEAVPEGYFIEGDSHWYVAAWDEGVTEGGSSGSPIFDDMKRIRGQLHGGYASCSYLYSDYYGRLGVSWDYVQNDPSKALKTHLDPKGTGTRVTDAMPLNAARAKMAKKAQKAH